MKQYVSFWLYSDMQVSLSCEHILVMFLNALAPQDLLQLVSFASFQALRNILYQNFVKLMKSINRYHLTDTSMFILGHFFRLHGFASIFNSPSSYSSFISPSKEQKFPL